MLKKILLLFILFIGVSASASDNFLNSIIINKEETGTSVILRSDEIVKLKKEVETQDRISIILKGIKKSPDITTLYKNIPDLDGIVLQSKGKDLAIYIDAPDIAKANIVFETPDSAPMIVSNVTKSNGYLLWSLISFVILLAIIKIKSKPVKMKKKDINEIIKEREKQMYKNFQREVATIPSINYKLKSYSKYVLKGETIRSYENRITKLINS